jgi:uncharacterized protein (DUF697 family)
MKDHLQEIGAIVVAVVLTFGIVALAITGTAVPAQIDTGFGLSLGWLFGLTVKATANGNGNGAPK